MLRDPVRLQAEPEPFYKEVRRAHRAVQVLSVLLEIVLRKLFVKRKPAVHVQLPPHVPDKDRGRAREPGGLPVQPQTPAEDQPARRRAEHAHPEHRARPGDADDHVQHEERRPEGEQLRAAGSGSKTGADVPPDAPGSGVEADAEARPDRQRAADAQILPQANASRSESVKHSTEELSFVGVAAESNQSRVSAVIERRRKGRNQNTKQRDHKLPHATVRSIEEERRQPVIGAE